MHLIIIFRFCPKNEKEKFSLGLVGLNSKRSTVPSIRTEVSWLPLHHSFMAEKEDSEVNSPQPPPFLEVTCQSLGKNSRFAAGTKAGFAVSLINRKLEIGAAYVTHIEAIKDGEEPISFGPDAVLVDYGNCWKLQTVTELDFGGVGQAERLRVIPRHISNVRTVDNLRPAKAVPKSGISFLYIAKILFAFILLLVLGAIFTLALENLPKAILFINSFV